MIRKWMALLSTSVLVASCGDGVAEPEMVGPRIQTDALAYAFTRDTLVLEGDRFPRYHATIGYTYFNGSDEPIYIVQCQAPEVAVQRLSVSGAWEDYWSRGSLLCLSPPTTIPPNEQYSSAFEFSGVEFGVEGFSPSFPTADVAGTYRMFFPMAVRLSDPTAYPNGTPLPIDQRSSNPFEMTVR